MSTPSPGASLGYGSRPAAQATRERRPRTGSGMPAHSCTPKLRAPEVQVEVGRVPHRRDVARTVPCRADAEGFGQ